MSEYRPSLSGRSKRVRGEEVTISFEVYYYLLIVISLMGLVMLYVLFRLDQSNKKLKAKIAELQKEKADTETRLYKTNRAAIKESRRENQFHAKR